MPAAFAYTYDAVGNITRGPLGAYTYGDPAHVHAATAAGTTHRYSYDANGAVLTRTEGARTYTHGYDVQGRQTSVAVAGGSTSTFVYNGDGALVARQVGGRTVAHYAAGGLYEHDPMTGVRRKYATFGGQPHGDRHVCQRPLPRPVRRRLAQGRQLDDGPALHGAPDMGLKTFLRKQYDALRHSDPGDPVGRAGPENQSVAQLVVSAVLTGQRRCRYDATRTWRACGTAILKATARCCRSA